MEIDKKLQNLISSSNEYLNKQIDFIIDILQSDEEENINEEEYVEELDNDDEQIDENYVSLILIFIFSMKKTRYQKIYSKSIISTKKTYCLILEKKTIKRSC